MRSRVNVVSFNSIARGGLVDETYALLSRWDFSVTREENFERALASNYIGIRSVSYLRDIVKALKRRLDPEGRERGLTVMAQRSAPAHIFKPCLLWHLTLDEFLLRDFLLNWLYPAFHEHALVVRSEQLHPFLRAIKSRGGQVKQHWTQLTIERAATALLRIAADFGLVNEGSPKRFLSYSLPEEAFVYVLHGLAEVRGSTSAAVRSHDWRMFLMHPADVERELLRLHQYRKLEYQVAGSLVQLTLPCSSSREYAERMVA
ncbi:MAG TPA: BrxA family protein [Gemmatimonadaceae bacterium]